MGASRAFVALANAAAGSSTEDAVGAACEVLTGGGTCDVVRTEDEEGVDACIADLGDRELVVFGGDGSIHVAIARLDAAGVLGEVELAIVPLGTGNDLARTLGLPLDPAEAARVALEGTRRQLDLIELEDGRCAVNAVHGGVGAVAAERAADLKEGIGALAYPLGALSAGMAVDGWDVTVTVDGELVRPERGDALLMVAVGNGRTIGGGTELFPDADPGDGQLDVVVSHAVGPAARATYAIAMSRGTHPARPDVAVARGREIEVVGRSLPWNVDGELTGEVELRLIRVRPRAWTVRVPRA